MESRLLNFVREKQKMAVLLWAAVCFSYSSYCYVVSCVCVCVVERDQ